MKRAKEELGKAFLNLANLLLVLFLFNTYLQQVKVNFWIVIATLYGVGALYWMGYYLIRRVAMNSMEFFAIMVAMVGTIALIVGFFLTKKPKHG